MGTAARSKSVFGVLPLGAAKCLWLFVARTFLRNAVGLPFGIISGINTVGEWAVFLT